MVFICVLIQPVPTRIVGGKFGSVLKYHGASASPIQQKF